MQKTLISGILAIDRSVQGRDLKLTDKNMKDAKAKSFMVKGEAYNQDHGIVLLEIESGDKRVKRPYILACYRKKTGEICIAYPLPSSYPTWHLATAVDLLNKYQNVNEKIEGTIVSVYVASPVILGGSGWQIVKKGTCPIFNDVENLINSGSNTVESNMEADTVAETEEHAAEIVADENTEKKEIKDDAKGRTYNHPVYGRLDEDENVIVDYLSRWPEFRVRQLLETRRINKKIFVDPNALSHIANPKQPDWIWFSGQEWLEDGFIRYKRGKSLALESYPGGGKEKYFLTMSYLLHQPVAIILCNGGTTEMQLEGMQVLTVDKNTGSTVTGFQIGLAIQLLQKGYIVVLDEVNAVNPAYTFIFHDIANGSRKVISNAAKKEIEIHERAWFCITINRGTNGTYDLNEAFGDRMSWLILDRLRDITPIIEANVPDIQQGDKIWLAKLYSGLLELAEQGQLDTSVLSVRGFIDLAERLAERQPRERAVRIALINKIAIQNPRLAQKLEPILTREAQ